MTRTSLCSARRMSLWALCSTQARSRCLGRSAVGRITFSDSLLREVSRISNCHRAPANETIHIQSSLFSCRSHRPADLHSRMVSIPSNPMAHWNWRVCLVCCLWPSRSLVEVPRTLEVRESPMPYVRGTFTGERARQIARLGSLSGKGVRPQSWWPEDICQKIEKIV